MTTTEYRDGNIDVNGGRLKIAGYEDDEPVLVNHFGRVATEVRPSELHRVLVLGVYAADAVPGALTFRDVAEDADRATREMRTMVGAAKKEAEDAIQQQADAMKRALTDELAKYCAPDRATSIPANVEAKVKAIVDAAKDAMKSQLDAALNVTREDAPLAQILGKLNGLSAQLHEILGHRNERTSAAFSKGDDYQQVVFQEVARIAGIHGDSAEFTGNHEGHAGTKAGDITVTLDGNLAAGRDIRIVFEAMDREAKGNARARLDAVVEELEQASRNRVASGAVAVASNPAIPAAGGLRLNRPCDSKFIVVLDKENWDPLALEVAYCLAKVEAIRLARGAGSAGADLAKAAAIVGRLVARLDDFGKLQGNLRDGQGAFIKAMELSERIKTELASELSTLRALLSGGAPAADESAA